MRKHRILIVEDEETSRKVIALALKGDDRELLFARDGDEAVRQAVEHRPDLIVMDMMLPRLDGGQATRIIKANKELKDIPVVALTARTGDYDEDSAREAGCVDYVTKPFRIEHLRERLKAYLKGPGAR
jgi:CheY-like chemotaxis protein